MQGSVHCPSCGRQIPVGDINIDRLVGRCTACEKLFDIEEQGFGQSRLGGASFSPSTPSAVSTTNESDAIQRPRYSQPDSVKLFDDGRTYNLAVRWWGPQYVVMAVFCIFWDGFLIFWYSALLTDFNLMAALFPLLHVAAGVFITWTTLAGFLNTTVISLSSGRFKLTHGPIPWKGGLDMSSADLSQFFVVEKIGNKGSRYHELCALLKDDRKIMVLSSSIPLDTLRYLEQELETKLGIEDRRVLGEAAG